MKISINANRCEPSPMRKFHPMAVQAEKNGKTIYHLNIGQPDLPTPPAYYDAIRNYDAKTLSYEASPGMPALIDAVRNYSWMACMTCIEVLREYDLRSKGYNTGEISQKELYREMLYKLMTAV